MSRVSSVLRDILGLFVDDGRFALAILAWVGAAGLALPRIGVPAGAAGAVLFAGLVLILVESVVRRARR